MLGLNISMVSSGAVSSEALQLIDAFQTRVRDAGGNVESPGCLETTLAFFLT